MSLQFRLKWTRIAILLLIKTKFQLKERKTHKLQNLNIAKRLRDMKINRAMLISFGIALFFWLLIKMSKSYQNLIKIDMEYQVSEDEILLEPLPDQLSVVVRGSGWKLLQYGTQRKGSKAKIDLSNVSGNTVSYSNLRTGLIKSIPSSVDIISVSPEQLYFSIDKKVSKEIPIDWRAKVSLSPTHKLLNEVDVTPNTVTITGPESLLRDISSWPTEEAIFELDESQSGTIDLLQVKSSTSSLSINEVDYRIEIEQVTEKTLEVPIQVIGTDEEIDLIPESVQVSFTTGLSSFEAMKNGDFSVVADFTEVNLDSTQNVALRLEKSPDLVDQVRLKTSTAQFIITRVD